MEPVSAVNTWNSTMLDLMSRRQQQLDRSGTLSKRASNAQCEYLEHVALVKDLSDNYYCSGRCLQPCLVLPFCDVGATGRSRCDTVDVSMR